MKKETAILMMIIALLVGFALGATMGIFYMVNRGEKLSEIPGTAQRSQMESQEDSEITHPGRDPIEVASQIQTLKEMVKKDPNNLSAWVELGNLYFDTNQPKEAIEAYSQYLVKKPSNPDVRTDMGIMFRSLGQFDRAIEEFQKAAQSDPKHINSRYNIGIVLLHDKDDIKGAIKAWEDYLKVDPHSERAKRIKAQIEKMKTMPPPVK